MMALSVDTAPAEANRFEVMRHAMVASQLRTNAVNDVRVVEVMARVPREDFLPEENRAIAYRDTLLPLPGGRSQNLPLATGRLLTVANVRPTDKVLLIGGAGGYAAALLADLATSVVAVEEEPALAALARTALAGYANVEPIEGPLAAGHASEGPYDLLVVDGAVEELPAALLDQLKPDGRVVTGIVDRGVTRLATGQRTEGGFGLTDFADIECAVLPGFERLRTFKF
ncbi:MULTISPECIES: protein-L-isoaspartate O-methyltransferase family protein [unclassified Sphingomonas]|uniref:protein-L-isoaspartate O-methyltransferase family protein n=1 Tax=unclassified Sphingomonas TaxID=196159 RepID=UPI0022B338C3|nr:protein-L-isoaspartate O-methyltransferase [Sphingomonas sp. NIBR02145]WHU03849.1 protein-L-isoaspartate O-methyltransferase [Sphingomonas sp. NIBR02145]